MQLNDFNYKLPTDLIAQQALDDRAASRLLVLNGSDGQYQDRQFRDIVDLIQANDLLVFNNTKVIPARLYGSKQSGGKVEVLIERILANQQVWAHVRANRAPQVGSHLCLEKQLHVQVIARQDALFCLQFETNLNVLESLEQHGHIPLPPYIDRADTEADRQRYQTIFAKTPGAVAAPTAGLHFDQALLTQLKKKGVAMQAVTLHVGAGTFQPVRVEDVSEHNMHSEWFEVRQSVCDAIAACQQRGGRVIAVGTTSVRSLESLAERGKLTAFSGNTRLFITPGYRFRVVDAMLTNFHLPESTLLMLVSAFSGYQAIRDAYQHAITERYRFFSYGDAMFLTPTLTARNHLD